MTIYDISPTWLNDNQLEKILAIGLYGFQSQSIKPRTRSKEYKEIICSILNCDIPKSFKKTKPKFPIHNFDLYIQSSNNLQIWNDEIDLNRRYVIIKVDENGKYLTLKVINGNQLIHLDTTSKLTLKLQAILNTQNISNSLVCMDTSNLQKYTTSNALYCPTTMQSPSDIPKSQEILSMTELFTRLSKLIGISFLNVNSDRQRGDFGHRLSCEALGYMSFSDNGQFPDILNQLLEVKSQTSPTIDIGKENPVDTNLKQIGSILISNEDIRYLILYMKEGLTHTVIQNIILVNGKNFFTAFKQMNGTNTKIQLPLPTNFFS